jgi:hypothetical protein
MENITNVSTKFLDCYKQKFIQIIFRPVEPAMTVLSIITSLLCVITFWRILRNENQQQQNGQMFKNFFVSSLAEFFYLFLNLILSSVYAEFVTFATAIYAMYFGIHLPFSFYFISNWFELAATIDCYLKITNKLKSFTTKKAFNIYASVIIIAGIMNPIWGHFRATFNRVSTNITINGNVTKTRYYYAYMATTFYNTPAEIGLRLSMNNLKDTVPIVLILIINILILKTLRKVMKKKRQLIKSGSNNNSNVAKFDADVSKLKMIIVMSVNYFIFRSFFLYNLATPYIIKNYVWNCFVFMSSFINIFTFFNKFFIFYFYNKLFKKHFNSLFTRQ